MQHCTDHDIHLLNGEKPISAVFVALFGQHTHTEREKIALVGKRWRDNKLIGQLSL